jgi:hypothetical protein
VWRELKFNEEGVNPGMTVSRFKPNLWHAQEITEGIVISRMKLSYVRHITGF